VAHPLARLVRDVRSAVSQVPGRLCRCLARVALLRQWRVEILAPAARDAIVILAFPAGGMGSPHRHIAALTSSTDRCGPVVAKPHAGQYLNVQFVLTIAVTGARTLAAPVAKIDGQFPATSSSLERTSASSVSTEGDRRFIASGTEART